MTVPEPDYLPAMGRHWLLPLYDTVTALLGLDRARLRLLGATEKFSAGERVLDVGCGTGTLAVSMAQQSHVEMWAIDPDPKALLRAQRRAARAGARVRFDRGFADALPYADGFFDAVVSSLMFHHLDRSGKRAMLREVVRVLKPGGRFLLLDFVGSEHGGLARATHARGQLDDNTASVVLNLMSEAGLDNPRQIDERDAARGLMRLACYGAGRP